MLKVEALFTEYTNELGQPVKAAQDIHIDVPEGHFFTLLGPSGCGKTTTLRSIAGLERPKSGQISVSDVVVSTMGAGAAAATVYEGNSTGWAAGAYVPGTPGVTGAEASPDGKDVVVHTQSGRYAFKILSDA